MEFQEDCFNAHGFISLETRIEIFLKQSATEKILYSQKFNNSVQ